MPTTVIGNNTDNDFPGYEDSYLHSDDADGNWSGEANVAVSVGSSIQRGVLRFSGLANIAPGVTVTGARIRLYHNLEEAAMNFEFYRLLRSWVAGEVTWNSWSAGNAWATPGALGSGDADASDSGAYAVAEATGAYDELELGGKALQDIEDWINEVVANNGWLIRAENETPTRYRFFASDGGSDGQRPELEVDWVAAGEAGEVQDTAVASDSVAASLGADRAVADTAVASDAPVGSAGKLAVVSEVAVATEHMATIVKTAGAPEIVLASDAATATQAATQAVTEGAVATDAALGSAGKAGAAMEGAVASDVAAARLDAVEPVADTAVASDSVVRGGAELGQLSESAVASDAVAVRAAVEQLIQETAVASDSIVVTHQARRSVTEGAVASDSGVAVLAAAQAITETAVASDTPAVRIALSPIATKTGPAIHEPMFGKALR